jgi:uncharacterized protein YqgC (DUF456 family)
MTSGQVQQLIDAVKAASPALWAAAQHQVQAQIVQDWMWMGVFAVLTLIAASASIFGWMLESDERSSDNAGIFGIVLGVFCGLAALVCLILVGVNVNDLIAKYNAPDYAAIQNLTSLLPSP